MALTKPSPCSCNKKREIETKTQQTIYQSTNVDRAEQSLELVRVFHVDLEARPQISQLGIWDPFWGGTLFKKEQE